MGENAVTADMKAGLEKKAKAIIDQKQPFERVVVTKEQCLELFKANPFKLAMIKGKLPDGSSTTVCRNGPFVDLYRGRTYPHREGQGLAMAKTSSALWLGKQSDTRRCYRIVQRQEGAHRVEDAAGGGGERDLEDRRGPEAALATSSRRSCFFLKHGARIYNS